MVDFYERVQRLFRVRHVLCFGTERWECACGEYAFQIGDGIGLGYVKSLEALEALSAVAALHGHDMNDCTVSARLDGYLCEAEGCFRDPVRMVRTEFGFEWRCEEHSQ